MSFAFTCPHCNVVSNLPDDSSGRSVSCPSCGMLSSTGSGNQPPPIRPDVQNAGMSPAAPAKKGTILGMPTAVFFIVLIVAILFVVVACGGILAALLLPAIQAVREAARANTCKANLRNVELAMEMYQIEKGTYPPAYTIDANGRRLHSWRTLLLPYLDEQSLYDQIRLDEPWDSPHNRLLGDTIVETFRCPSAADGERTFTNYAVVVGPKTIFPGSTSTRPSQIKDGLSRTVMIVEVVDSGIHWMEPKDLDSRNMDFRLNGSANEISSHHPGRVHVAMADGTIRSVPESASPSQLRAMSTISGGELTELPWDD